MPVYNCFHVVKDAVEDILTRTRFDFEFLIIDNNSTDADLLLYLNSLTEPGVRVIKLKSNIFYWPAVNTGIKLSHPENKFILILNSDIRIESDTWLEYLLEILNRDKHTGYVGDFINQPDLPPAGGWVDGWCMLFKRTTFRDVGLFTNKYIWYHNPKDYLIRAFKKGFRVRDIKQPGDQHNHIKGVIRHLVHRSFDEARLTQDLPINKMLKPRFSYGRLLLQHGLIKQYFLYMLLKHRSILPLSYRTRLIQYRDINLIP